MYAAKLVFLACAFSVLVVQSEGFFLFDWISNTLRAVKKVFSFLPFVKSDEFEDVYKGDNQNQEPVKLNDKKVISGFIQKPKTSDEFNKLIAKCFDQNLNPKWQTQLVVLYFSGKDCNGCKMMDPRVWSLAKHYKQVVFIKMDMEDRKLEQTVNQYEVTSSPTVKFIIDNNKVAATIEGAEDTEAVRNKLRELQDIK